MDPLAVCADARRHTRQRQTPNGLFPESQGHKKMREELIGEWTDGTMGEWPTTAPSVNGQHRAPLTVRTIDEILAMTFDEADLILPNGYATKSDLTALCGMGGIGKTRLTMQFALCCRAERDFLGWPTNGRNLRFLFLQTENSCRRLQADLQKMLNAFTRGQQTNIKAGVFFHTLENDDDGLLMLDAENKERITAKITDTVADVVIWDPLRDFSLDDLNSDKFMGETLRDIVRITKRGNPKRLPLVLHHAATGKAGAQKTTGWDRSSFGRNSKVLQMVARAVINVAPAKPDDNSVIIVGSGKCSNAPEFEPFAVRLDFETMLYAPDNEFDLQEWREEVGCAKTPRKPTKDILRGVLQPGREYDQKNIVERIKEEELVSQSTAYRIVNEGKTRRILRRNKVTKTYALA
ncbi:MAG: hypothetical protein C5B58_07310 [Acidobacteria bacterium]|nr:MAG: hypothetical protein C5B58_07310 [Acidobacteriota bacterium]